MTGDLINIEKIEEIFSEKVVKGVLCIKELIQESYGVEGLHRNGDVARWDQLRTGGYFEEWLKDFDILLEGVEKQELGKRGGK